MALAKGSCWVSVLLFVAAAARAVVEDVLHSRRSLGKRFIDSEGNYNISFYHINDVHAHLDEFTASDTNCTDKTVGCYGGYARVKTVMKETRPDHEDSLFLNVGDEFQGTPFYTHYGGEKIAATLNQMGFDAMTIGNHEFDGGPEALAAFLSNLTFPIVSANIHSNHSVLNATIKPFHIFPQYELAVIGVTTDTTPNTSDPGPGTTFSDPIAAVQNTINLIKSTTNIKRIAAITHIGYEQDQALAESTTGLQLIMGGHSHTLLGDMEGAAGPYPTIRLNKDGDEVFIVTAMGRILAYHGAPIHLTNSTAQDPELQAQINGWRSGFEDVYKQEVGVTDVPLGAALLVQFLADGMVDYCRTASRPVDFALITLGTMRVPMDQGPITRGTVATSFPFNNVIVEVSLSGEEIWNVLEGVFSMANHYTHRPVVSGIQVSHGIQITMNHDAAPGRRLLGVTIGHEELVRTKIYRVATLGFLAQGGANIFRRQPEFTTLEKEEEVLIRYVAKKSPINASFASRIVSKNDNGTVSVYVGAVSGFAFAEI
ncbi:unnamed protein product [Diplocarpon coronariae]|nr:Metallo-dependent phosphatase [Diplocarpon mali]